MKKTAIVLGFIFCSSLVIGKGGKDKSYYGQVTLNNEEIVQGDLKVDQIHQLVFVQKDEAIDTLQAAEIRSLNFKGKGGLQEFVTYDFPNQNNIPVPTMFRVVWTSGEIKLLERVVSPADTKIVYKVFFILI